eukprot:CAMPEP_0169098502 /NCGR_PEP_ID=MMETSP1015-20121227/20074_1 /TAXON_ID=342587 /ORGANISM="Karlodinium micrum, Strain CCMP2283" /LENGTH=252 /DNA_ID=CAMNT_0009159353 /DNA_START=42 /DNA_END=800 /DNA_ORIENTATION=-
MTSAWCTCERFCGSDPLADRVKVDITSLQQADKENIRPQSDNQDDESEHEQDDKALKVIQEITVWAEQEEETRQRAKEDLEELPQDKEEVSQERDNAAVVISRNGMDADCSHQVGPTSSLLSVQAPQNSSMLLGNKGLRLQRTWEDVDKCEAEQRERIEEQNLRAQRKVDLWCKKHGYKGVHTAKMTFKGCTKYALHTAVKHKDIEMVRLLLKCGANKRARNSKGQTPCDLALAIDKGIWRNLRNELVAALR